MELRKIIVGAGIAVAVAAVAVAGPRAMPALIGPQRAGPSRPAAARALAGAAAAVPGPAFAALTVAPAAGATVAGAAVSASATSQAAAAAGSGAAAGGLGDVVVRRVEQSADVTLRVQDVASAFTAASSVAAALGGYVQSSTLQSANSSATASLVLAVPEPQFAALLQQLGSLGKVLETDVTGQDVTQQYVDLQGRLTALQAERQSYLTLLGKATAIGDILQIEQQLTDVESQIEDLQGQLNVLDALSAMAQVTVTLQPPLAVPPHRPAPLPAPLQRVGAAFTASVQTLAAGAVGLARGIAWIVPWGVLGLGAFALLRWLVRPRT